MATHFDRLKAAWDTGAPLALDHEAESLASQGVAGSEIYDALEKLLLEVRAGGADDDTEERINGVMDRLTGWVHPSQQIHTARTGLPTAEGIAALPRWARVAFAARCARRVVPLYKHFWPGTLPTAPASLQWATEVAERFAAQAGGPDHLASDAGGEAAVLDRLAARYDPACYAAAAASFAADAACRATRGEVNPEDGFVMGAALSAANTVTDLTPTLRRDFDHLAALAGAQRWTDDMPVPPEVFGPLWPEGPPAGWPADPDVPSRTELPVTLVAREGVESRVIADEAVNLFHALNRYHIARTGLRLTLKGDIFTLLSRLVPAGAT